MWLFRLGFVAICVLPLTVFAEDTQKLQEALNRFELCQAQNVMQSNTQNELFVQRYQVLIEERDKLKAEVLKLKEVSNDKKDP